MNLNYSTRLARSSCLSLLSLAVVATASQPQRANAIDLNFSTTTQTQTNTNPFNFNFGPGVGNSGPTNSNTPTGSTGAVVVNYTNVAAGVDARVTAQTFGANYSFVEHIPNYSVNTAGEPSGDAAFLYQLAANQTGAGGMTYKFELFQSGTNFTTAYTATDLRFLVYDVDGDTPTAPTVKQTEDVRVFKGVGNTGFSGYQVARTNPLTVIENANSYLFRGAGTNLAETSASGATVLYFDNTSSFTLQFEANTLFSNTNNDPVFSAIDGDLSLLGATEAIKTTSLATNYQSRVTAQKLPEPFTIIGSLIGGTAAFRLRKKLKDATKA